MLKNPFKTFYLVENDLEDFKMPYRLYGTIDLENMTEKYNSLTNKPKHYLHVRFHNGQAKI